MNGIGVVILSHRGFSFAEKISAGIRARGLKVFILSSLPEDSKNARVDALTKIADAVNITQDDTLTLLNVNDFLARLSKDGYQALCVMTVWEGYRALMAHANNLLGVADMAANTAESLRNKYEVRKRLNERGLSKVTAEIMTEKGLEILKRAKRRKFIKPTLGIASFGTFPLRDELCWDHLDLIRKDWEADPIFKGMFSTSVEFMAEDYISGVEVSFECIMFRGELFVFGVHEKVDVSTGFRTMLESACVMPPENLCPEVIAKGIEWLKPILSAFDIGEGCYHIEAKCEGEHWEIIEINNRLGGSLISDSVKAFNGEASHLELWLDTLLCTEENQHAHRNKLEKLSYLPYLSRSNHNNCYFRVFFCEAGRIRHIKENKISRIPDIVELLAEPGMEFESDAKENFVGHALWTYPNEEKSLAAALQQESKYLLDILVDPIETNQELNYA